MARKNGRAPTDWGLVSNLVSGALTGVLLLALGAGLTVGVRPLEARAAAVLGAKPPGISVSWPTYQAADGSHASWLPEQFQDDVRFRAELALDPDAGAADLFRRDSLRAVGEAMRTSGWFEGTPTVTRREGGEIHVQGNWRVPAALVRTGAKDRLVSWNAEPMPVEYGAAPLDSAEAARRQPVILGVGAPAPADGSGGLDLVSTWPGEDLRAALELLSLLSQQPWHDQVAAVDSSAYDGKKQLTIVTRRGGRLVWGGRPSAPLIGEVSTSAKIGHINRFFRETRSIDANQAYVEVWGTHLLTINVSASAPKQ